MAWSILSLAGFLAITSGDTIYLKDGTTIKAFILEQTEEKVTFIRSGGTVAISMARVEKIVKDSHGILDEEEARRTSEEAQRRRFEGSSPPVDVPPDAAGREPGAAVSSPPPGVFPPDEVSGEQSVPADIIRKEPVEEEDETKTAKYWQNLKIDLERKIEEKNTKLRSLEIDRRGRAQLFISTTAVREEIERTKQELAELETKYRELPEKARKAGVPPGWLR